MTVKTRRRSHLKLVSNEPPAVPVRTVAETAFGRHLQAVDAFAVERSELAITLGNIDAWFAGTAGSEDKKWR